MISVWVDGSCLDNGGPNAIAGIGVIIYQNNKKLFQYRKLVSGKTNNEAEYQAVLSALKALRCYNTEEITIYSDSILVVQQIQGNWKIKQESLRQLRNQIVNLICQRQLENIKFKWISRIQNFAANELAQSVTLEKRSESYG